MSSSSFKYYYAFFFWIVKIFESLIIGTVKYSVFKTIDEAMRLSNRSENYKKVAPNS